MGGGRPPNSVHDLWHGQGQRHMLGLLSSFLVANSLEKERILNIHYCKIPLRRTQGASVLRFAWVWFVLVLQYSRISANMESVVCWNVKSSVLYKCAARTRWSYVKCQHAVDHVWNVTAQAQKPNFFFWRNGRAHSNRRGASVQSTTGRRGMRISGSNAG